MQEYYVLQTPARPSGYISYELRSESEALTHVGMKKRLIYDSILQLRLSYTDIWIIAFFFFLQCGQSEIKAVLHVNKRAFIFFLTCLAGPPGG